MLAGTIGLGGVRTRRAAAKLAAVAAATAVLALVPAGANAAPAPGPVDDFAYASMTRGTGGWPYKGSAFYPRVVGPLVRDSGADWVRVSEGGLPIDIVGDWYDRFHAQVPSMKLGVKIPVDGRPLARVLAKGRRLKHKPDGCTPAPSLNPCFYDWILLDHALWINSIKLQRIVWGLRRQGWRVMSNDSPWPHTDTRLARGQAAHLHSFGILDRGDWNSGGRRAVARRIMDPSRPILTPHDRDFIRKVNSRDPNSTPLLKFEIHRQTDRLGQLRAEVQRRLLVRLDAAQDRAGFEMSYPLFVPKIFDPERAECLRPGRCVRYISTVEGTYATQDALMPGEGP